MLKHRRKAIYGEVKKPLREILRTLCGMKGATLIEGAIGKGHVHMYASVPPKIAAVNSWGILKARVRW